MISNQKDEDLNGEEQKYVLTYHEVPCDDIRCQIRIDFQKGIKV